MARGKDGYGTHRAVPTCRRCGQQHYNMLPCRDERNDPEVTGRLLNGSSFYIDPKEGNGEPVRFTRLPGNLPDGFRERHDELRTVTVFPGNRFYRVVGD